MAHAKDMNCYYKRYRMILSLSTPPAIPSLPATYVWTEWSAAVLSHHAAVLAVSFADSQDVCIFPKLGSLVGCESFMRELVRRSDFCPGATWLIRTIAGEYVAAIQGLLERGGNGAIQNVAVVPEHRQRGLGRALLLQAVRGFWTCNARTVSLEVTAANTIALELYRQVGFRCYKTIYREGRRSGMAVENRPSLQM